MSGTNDLQRAPLADQSARDAIENELSLNLVVEAAAGTGKTTALVSRIIQVIATGRGELKRLVAVTFTEKAAGELKLRLRAKLETARSGTDEPEARARLDRGLGQLEEAHIGTIHGFCADLLKERPLQAGVDPQFEVSTDAQTARLYRRVFERWLEEKLADPPPGIRRLLRRKATYDRGPIDELSTAGLRLIDIRDFPTPWEVRAFDRKSEIDDLIERAYRLEADAQKRSSDRDFLFKDLRPLVSFVQDLRGQEHVAERRDYDALEHELPALRLGKRKGRGAYAEGVSRDDLLETREDFREALFDFKKRAGADRTAHLHAELQELVDRYQIAKTKRGQVDFLDLLVKTRDLLRDDPGVRSELQQRFTHLFVDEFQDTDPLQAEILLLLSASDSERNDWLQIEPAPGKLFVVADPKQSIYRFRRADVTLYQKVRRQLVASGAKPVYLSVSFRSVPHIQEIVNASMGAVMKPTETNSQAEYVALEPQRPPIESQPPVVALPIPRPYGDWGNLTQYAMQKSEPTAVAAWLRWLVDESGYRVSQRGTDETRAVVASDVCLLFRRLRSGNRSITLPYVEALQGLDVPHVLVGGRGFHQREEIEAVRMALTAIERPDDELAVFSTLRGPLYSLSDDVLFRTRTEQGPLHPFRRPTGATEGEAADLDEALGALADLHKKRNYRPIALTIRDLLDRTRAQAGFALWQAGDQVLSNVLRLMQIARQFEDGGGLSFRGFVEHLDTLADDSDRTEQPVIEDGVEGVRLMTVHKAKGLEFPIVVLCDITCSMSMGASRHVDPVRKIFAVRFAGGSPWELLDHEADESERDKAEGQRLLYVAATRARDLLAVPVVADRPQDSGWVGPLLPALYPEPKTYRLPVVAKNAPRFTGDECVIGRPSRSDIMPGDGIKPGVHRPKLGSHDVLWWDPEHFERDTPTKPGLRRHWILAPQSGPVPVSGAGGPLHTQWEARRVHRSDTASKPRLIVDSVTRVVEESKNRSGARMPGAERIEVAEVPGRSPTRPTGKRFGTLVHELLARTDLDAGPEVVHALAESLSRTLDARPDEAEAAATAVVGALAHPLLESARRASACHKETPMLHREATGRLIEAIPDLVFQPEDGGDWVVVDFKTDLRIDMASESYREQVALYVEALSAATGDEAKGVLLFV